MRWTICGLLVFALWSVPVPATPTLAKPLPTPAVAPVPAAFELATLRKPGLAADQRDTRADPLLDPEWEHGFKPQRFKYTPLLVSMGGRNGGPMLAAGALGARRKGVPKLAHVAFSWEF